MKKILLFGDSNTWGHNPVDMARLSRPWPVILEKLIPQFTFTVDGVCGRTTEYIDPNDADNIDKIGIASFEHKYINTGELKNYDLVIIMLGTNDLLNSSRSNPEQIAKSLKKFVNIIKYSSDAEILIVSPINIKKSCMTHPVFSKLYSIDSVMYSKKIASFTEAMAKNEQVHFLDASLFASPSDIDGIHLDPQGHEKLAYAINNKIREIFI